MAKTASGASEAAPAGGGLPPRKQGPSRPLMLSALALFAVSSRVAVVPRRDDEQLLVRARELVARGWCREALAEDARGRHVDPWSRSACRWSPLGALVLAWCELGGEHIEAFATAYLALSFAAGGTVADWNAAPWQTKQRVTRGLAHARAFLPAAREQERALRRDHDRGLDRDLSV